MRQFRTAGLAALAATPFLALGFPSPVGAQEITIDDTPDAPFDYSVCYAANDALNPGPAAHFGQDVCVDYVAVNGGILRITDWDLEWQLFQHGTATVIAQADGSVLYDGPFEAQEIAVDLGNDADCLWSTADGGDGEHAWLGYCATPGADLDQLSWRLELYGETPFSYEATVSGPGEWCAFDSDGNQFGPACG